MSRAAVALSFVPALVLALGGTAAAQDLRIYHLDVEQADATLVISPDGRTLLMDGGNTGAGSGRVAPRLEALGVTVLDFMVASHYHADHVGGLDEVVAAGFPPDVAYDRGGSYSSQAFTSYAAAVGAVRRTIEPGEVFALGTDVTIECVAVNGITADGRNAGVPSADENGLSVALVLRYRGFDYFIAGDLEGGGLGTTDVESLIAPLVRDLDVLRMCHHGSESATNQNLIARTLPDVAVLSCGFQSQYGHPHIEPLQRLQAAASCAAIWATNRGSANTVPKLTSVGQSGANDGEILIRTDGLSGFTVNGVEFPLVVDSTPPTIASGPSAGGIGGSTATISWTTDEPCEAIVEYGTTAAYGSLKDRRTLAAAHAIGLTGLAAQTTYHYRAGALDATGNGPAWSGDLTFTTGTGGGGSGGVVINEVVAAGSEWVEIYNGSPAAVDMTGWDLTDNDSHTFTFPAFALPAGAYVVVTSDSSGTDDPDASDGLATFHAGTASRFGTTAVWNNTGDDVHLLDAGGATVDWCAFGSGTGVDPFPPGQWAGPNPAEPGTGQSVARFPNGTDSNQASDFDPPGATTRGLSNGGEPPPPPVPPTADAGPVVAGIEGGAVQFDGTDSRGNGGATIVSYAWTFGDGGTATGATPSHVFADDGDWQATLTVTDSNGLTATDSTSAGIANVAPGANAGGSYAGTAGDAIAFAGTGTDPSPVDAASLTYSWSFGDGTPAASGASVSHVYAAAGTYAVTLSVTDKDGAVGTSGASASVAPPPVPPTADAGPTVSGAEGAALAFDGSGSTPGSAPIVSYAWTFGDGGTGSGATPVYAYGDDGSFTVTLVVTDANGLTASDTTSAAASNVAPSASAGGPYSGTAGEAIAFAGAGNDPSPADAASLTYSWDFGDGTPAASGASASHAYAAAGSYTVTLTVTDDDGGIGTSEASAAVAAPPVPPTADAGPAASGAEGAALGFDGSGSTPGSAEIVSYAWTFGDGGTGTGATPTHVYADDGAFTVTLVVTDANGLTSSDTTSAAASNVAPSASAGGPYAGTAGLAIAFAGTATDPSPADAASLAYSWDFGDGTPAASGASASHVYAAAGTYPVTLTVTDDDGGVGTSGATATVAALVPPTAHAGPAASGGEGATLGFDGSGSTPGSAPIVSYAWTFGDGGTGSGATPTHFYGDNGAFTVTLVVTDANGLTASDTTVALVANVAPGASAGGPYSGTEDQAISFAGSATDPSPVDQASLGFAWTFGDGSPVAGGANPSHAYASPGTYTVTLTVADKDGGSVTVETLATVAAAPPQNAQLTVTSARNNRTGTVHGAGSSAVQELNGAGNSENVVVYSGSSNWWEARFGAPPSQPATVESAVATVSYRMRQSRWRGTLTLELRAGPSGPLLGSRTLPESTSLATATWDVSSLVTPENAGALALRLVNVDPEGIRVEWAYARIALTYR